MKKIVLTMLVLVLAACTCVLAGAVPAEYEPDGTGAFQISYDGAKPGEYYALVIVSGIAEEGAAPQITEQSIQYIDQLTAGSDGVVTFDNVLLRTDGAEATVYLGGSNFDSALLLGYVNKGGSASEYTVSGTISSDSSKDASVKLTSVVDSASVYTITTADGVYTITVPADTYKFEVTKPAHLSYTKNELVVADNTTVDVVLKGGDVDGNGSIDFDDLSSLLLKYGMSEEEADINGDGVINFDDLSKLLLNYAAVSEIE